MGTNYYLCIPIDEAAEQNLLPVSHESDDYLYMNSVALRLGKQQGSMPELVLHVCKKSIGWKPLFEAHEGVYKSVRELVALLEANDRWSIVDEYDEAVPTGKFKKMLAEWNALTDVESHEKYSSGRHDYWMDADGYDFTEGEFW